MFVNIRMLDLKLKATDWHGDRGFFDESTAIARRRGLEDGYIQWTEAPVDPEDRRTNSHYGDDHSMWNEYTAQREREREQTLNQRHEGPLREAGELRLIV
jgi:hypothetical protein